MGLTSLEIGYIIAGVVFLILACLMAWLYYSNKRDIPEFIKKGDPYSAGSYKGFWYRNKYNAIIFSLYLFLILGLAFIFLAII